LAITALAAATLIGEPITESLRDARDHTAEIHRRRGQRHPQRVEKHQLCFLDNF